MKAKPRTAKLEWGIQTQHRATALTGNRARAQSAIGNTGKVTRKRPKNVDSDGAEVQIWTRPSSVPTEDKGSMNRECRCPKCKEWSPTAWQDHHPEGGWWWHAEGECPKCGEPSSWRECAFRDRDPLTFALGALEEQV